MSSRARLKVLAVAVVGAGVVLTVPTVGAAVVPAPTRAAGPPRPAVPARAAGPTKVMTRSYAGSDQVIANPDRGFTHYTETHYLPDGSGYTPLDAAQLTGWRTREQVTVVYRIFYLEKFTTQDTIDPAYLALVAADLATARATGVKVIVRFAYTQTSGADATPARVVTQIGQLAPILNASADVIATLQAGFIGQWGEWYYTDHFASDPTQPWTLTPADWAARALVLHALLDATDPTITVQVRYPTIKQHLIAADDPQGLRIGIHDDCFVASPDDEGTFTGDADRQWLAAQTRSVPMGGETCAVDPPRSQWPSAAADLAAYHWTFLNADYNTDVLNSWGTDALSEAARRLGYRLRLTDSAVPAAAPAGTPMAVHLTLTNDGYAAPFAPRPAQLILRGATATYRMPLPLDVRTVQPGTTVPVAAQITAPPTPGLYHLYLAFPDSATVLAGAPAYAIQLADTGTWDSVDGWNDLQQSVQVDPAPAPSASPTTSPSTSPDPSTSPSPSTPAATWVSSLTPASAPNGWGPWERDTSNGEAAAGDGRVQSLRGTRFPRGLGVHAFSSLTYRLNSTYRLFASTVGVDDETGGRGSVVFRVYVDGLLRYTSPVLTGVSAAVPVSVAVTGARTLRLVVSDAGDGNAYDHADWAGATLN